MHANMHAQTCMHMHVRTHTQTCMPTSLTVSRNHAWFKYLNGYRYVAMNLVNSCYNMVHDTLEIVMTNHSNGIANGVPGWACATLSGLIMKLYNNIIMPSQQNKPSYTTETTYCTL